MNIIGNQSQEPTEKKYSPYDFWKDDVSQPLTEKYGMSYERVQNPNDTARNIFSIGTQGFRSGNVEQGGGVQKQASLGEGITGGATGGIVDTRMNPLGGGKQAFTKFGGMGGADFGQIMKTGAATLSSAMSWVQGKKAQDLDQRKAAFDEYIKNVQAQDEANQNKFDTSIQDKYKGIGTQSTAATKTWVDQLAELNKRNSLASALSSQAQAGA